MKKRLKRISIIQFGLVLGVTYALLGLLFVPFFLIAGMFAPTGAGAPALFMGVGALIFTILYGIAGLVFGMIGAVFYNLAAKWTGGIEVTVDDAA